MVGQVHELKMVEDKLARTKVKYKMSRDVIAQLQAQLLQMSEEVRAVASVCCTTRCLSLRVV